MIILSKIKEMSSRVCQPFWAVVVLASIVHRSLVMSQTACYLTCNGQCTNNIVDPVSISRVLCIDSACASGIVPRIGLTGLSCIFRDQPSTRSAANEVAIVTCPGISTCVLAPIQKVQCYQCAGDGCGDNFSTSNATSKCTGGGCFTYSVTYPNGNTVVSRDCGVVWPSMWAPVIEKNLTKVSQARVKLVTCTTNLCNSAQNWNPFTVYYTFFIAVIQFFVTGFTKKVY